MWINFFFIVLLACLSEAINSSLLNKIVPVYFPFLCIKSNYVISFFAAFARIIIGVFIFLVCYWFDGSSHGEKVIFGILTFFKLLALLLLYLSSHRLRIKAITKLIKQRKELKDEFEDTEE